MNGMAGEIGHAVYAARLLTYLGDRVSDPAYWLGNLFPDIRHLGVISRHHTHLPHVGLTSLVGKNDFATGMRVHSWVDATREQFMKNQNMKEVLPWHPFVPHALKLLEDELLYQHFDDWNLIHRLLNTVHEEELFYITSKPRIQQWHTILQDYFSAAPTPASRKQLSQAIGLSANSAEEVNSVVEELRNNKKAQQLLTEFWKHLEHVLH